MSARDSLLHLPVADACWTRIGIRGDRSCPELVKHIHCNNCPVFATAAQTLLDRPAPAGYLAELTQFVAEPAVADSVADSSAVLFSVGAEQFAVASTSVLEVAETSAPRSVPHRSNDVFLGLVNIRGQLELCVSLQGLLGLSDVKPRSATEPTRVLVVSVSSQRWVLRIDAVKGVLRYKESSLLEAPPSSRRRTNEYLKGLLVNDGQHYGLLDLPRVCASFLEKLS